jgi:hypothetical protein
VKACENAGGFEGREEVGEPQGDSKSATVDSKQPVIALGMSGG